MFTMTINLVVLCECSRKSKHAILVYPKANGFIDGSFHDLQQTRTIVFARFVFFYRQTT